MRIVFLGDSLTWGGYGGNYVDEVQKRLPDDEIINAGVGGNTVVNLLERLESDVLAHEPDGVFVMVGGNDSVSYVQPKTRVYYKQVQNIPDGIVDPDLFAQTYRELLYQLQLAHVQTWMGLPPKEYNPATVEAMEQYNAIAEEVARSFNVPTLDLMAHFKPDHIPERPKSTWDLSIASANGRLPVGMSTKLIANAVATPLRLTGCTCSRKLPNVWANWSHRSSNREQSMCCPNATACPCVTYNDVDLFLKEIQTPWDADVQFCVSSFHPLPYWIADAGQS